MFTEPPAYPLVPDSTTSSAASSSQDLLNLRLSASTPPPAYTERPSRKFRITAAPGADMLNAAILDASGHALYTTSSDAKLKKTTVRRAAGPTPHPDSVPDAGRDLARVGWDRASPRMRFLTDADGTELPKKSKKHKIKCKMWLPRAGADTQSRVLTVHGTRYTIMERKGSTSYLLCSKGDADASPLRPLARWRTTPDAQSQQLEVFEDACATPGLLDALALALVVLQSGQPLGDVPDCLDMASPMYIGTGNLGGSVCFID